MQNTRLKDTLRLIKTSKGRYLSLILIVLIGTAFYTGVTASSTMMADNVDAYNDALHLKDITIYSNYGFDEDDIKAVESLDEVDKVEGSKFVDVIASDANTSHVTRIHSFQKDMEVSQFILVEGRLPENENEALAEKGSHLSPGFAVGDTIKLVRPDDDLDDFISVDTITIVGNVHTPVYLNEIKENSTLNNQYINTYLYVLDETFVIDYDLQLDVLSKNGVTFNSFYDAYQEYDESLKSEIETLARTQAAHRKDAIVSDAMEEYQKGYDEYLEGVDTFQKEVSDAQVKINQARVELQDGWNTLNTGKQELINGQATLNAERETAQSTIDEGWRAYNEGYEQYLEGVNALEEQKNALQDKINEINDGLRQVDEAISQLTQAKEGYRQIEEGISQINQAFIAIDILDNYLKLLPDDVKQSSISEIMTEMNAYSDEVAREFDLDESSTFDDYLNAFVDEENREEVNRVISENGDLNLIELQNQYPYLSQYFDEVPDVVKSFTVNELMQSSVFEVRTEMQSYLQDQNLLDSLGLTEENTIQELEEALVKQRSELEQTKASLEKQQDQIVSSLAENGITVDQIDTQIQSLNNTKNTLNGYLEQINSGLAEGQRQLDEAYALLAESWQQLTDGQNELNTKIWEGQQEINRGWNEIYSNQQKLIDGQNELDSNVVTFEETVADGKQELEDAKAKLDKALQDILDLEEGSWTVLDRSQHYASATFKNTVEQMRAIASIFPVFFLLVAALVCLTTMTRMVDEQRGQIGVMRALGYRPLQCAFKYLFYAGSSTVIGCTLGAIIGMLTFPRIIYTAWEMMYILPEMKIYINYPVILQAFVSFLAVTLLTTWFTCYKDMKDVPAMLLRPKSPKIGKSTLLEKIPFFWSSLSFTWKVTVRNLLRYKKRLVMTVFGVAGCTALLITGFGIKDSINTMVSLQFYDIMHYDGSVITNSEMSVSQIHHLSQSLEEREDVSFALQIGSYSGLVRIGDLEETANVMVFENNDEISQVYDLRTRKNHDTIQLDDQGVIISEKLSENLNVTIGDTIVLESKTGVKKEVVISQICEMYIQHYIYMTDSYYQSIFGTQLKKDTLLIQESDEADNELLQSELMEMEEVASISFMDAQLENFTTMVNSLDLIVWVLIISSMSLAFVVLGNLTNINISERQREIATLKVLGFHQKEVQSYIYKENNILTVLGAIAGIPLGNYLHHWIMLQVEMDYVMFGRSIQPISFIYSVILTVLFGVLVNQFMKKKLRIVQMVESLKSVE